MSLEIGEIYKVTIFYNGKFIIHDYAQRLLIDIDNEFATYLLHGIVLITTTMQFEELNKETEYHV